jgi:hypothetical protein
MIIAWLKLHGNPKWSNNCQHEGKVFNKLFSIISYSIKVPDVHFSQTDNSKFIS